MQVLAGYPDGQPSAFGRMGASALPVPQGQVATVEVMIAHRGHQ